MYQYCLAVDRILAHQEFWYCHQLVCVGSRSIGRLVLQPPRKGTSRFFAHCEVENCIMNILVAGLYLVLRLPEGIEISNARLSLLAARYDVPVTIFSCRNRA